MIAVDTSALIAIFLCEADEDLVSDIIFAAQTAIVAAPIAFEFLMVAGKKRPGDGPAEAPLLLADLGLRIDAWTYDHAVIAHDAFQRFGKGRHPAKLNFGDCMSYALAKSLGCPLLYTGDDFAQTDIVSAFALPQ